MPLPADLLVATIFALPDTRKAFTLPSDGRVSALALSLDGSDLFALSLNGSDDFILVLGAV